MPFKLNPTTGKLDLVQDLSGYVPYTGATADLNLGAFKLHVQEIDAVTEATFLLQGHDATTLNGPGGSVQANGGAGDGSGEGGGAIFNGGTGGDGNGKGGTVQFNAGSGGITDGDGGDIEFNAGSTAGGGNNGAYKFYSPLGGRYGIFNMDSINTSDKTITFQNLSGTVALTNVTQSISGLWTFTRGVVVDGTVDEIQLRLQGHSTQTSDLFVIENSVGTDILAMGLGSLRTVTHTPIADATSALGTTALRWTNLFLSGSVLDSASAQIYPRRTGADTMTGNWTMGSVLFGMGATAATNRLTVNASGTSTPGIGFTYGSSANERLITTVSGGFGFNVVQENSLTGNLQLRVNTADTLRYEFARDTNRFKIGSTAWGSWTALASEALSVEGLVQASKGASFNTGGGSTDPDNFFKVFKSDGTAGALHINPSVTSSGGVGFFTTTLAGILNFSPGLVSANKAGLAVTLQGGADNLTAWYSADIFSSSAFGFGEISENLATGDRLIFSKSGSANNVNQIYFKRDTPWGIGIGPDFGISGTTTGSAAPSARLHISAGTATAGTAPLKFTSGTSLTSAVAGCMEFTTDDLFFTITTGAARKRLLMADAVGGLTSGRIPFATTNGRLTDSSLFTFSTGSGLTLSALNLITDTTTGMKIGTATSQKLGFFNATPIVQPTTAVAAATFVANTSGIADDTATFDGYTIGQIAKALRNLGILA